MKNAPFRKVFCNQMQTAVYVRNAELEKTKIVYQRKYHELVEVPTQTGVDYQLVEKDNPITSDSVSSFAVSSDYKRDPLSAISNRPPRQNLGDVTQMQRILSMDMSVAQQMYKDLGSALSKATELAGKGNSSDDDKNKAIEGGNTNA